MADEFDVAKAEVGVWLQPPTELGIAKAEVGVWLQPPTELEVAKAEVGLWLSSSGVSARRRQMTVIN